MSAQVNVAARKQELIAGPGDLDVAWAQLREAMGVPDLKASELKPIEPLTFDHSTSCRSSRSLRQPQRLVPIRQR
jgi:hypothetical protein